MTLLRTLRLPILIAAVLAVTLGAVQTSQGKSASPPIGAYTTKGAWRFASAPALHPPQVRSDAPVKQGSLARGYFLLSNFADQADPVPMAGEGGPLILDSRLQPVWFYPVGTDVTSSDLKEQRYDGNPALSWWQGVVTRTGATSKGEDVVVDEHYRRVSTLVAKAPWVISVHDMVISGHVAWVTVYRNVGSQDLARYGGARRGTVYDSGVQEYDLSTGHLLYTWDALNPGGKPHIPLSDSDMPPSSSASPWDAYHINSIEPIGASSLLVSMRNTSAAYLIDTGTGRVVWKIGGDPKKPSSFSVAPSARFRFQHDVQLQGSRLTMFDDDCCAMKGKKFAPPVGPSRGLVLKVDFRTHTVTLVHQYLRTPIIHPAFLGSTTVLPGGNVLVGWGSAPYFSEYSSTGKLLLDAVFPGAGKDINYRALFSSTWVGTPSYPPSAALRRRGSRETIYASWNGATLVARWEVLAGGSAKQLRRVAIARRAGFETAIALPKGSFKVIKVSALDSQGRALGSAGVR